MSSKFIDDLKENGWMEVAEDWEYAKKNWFILRDTGSWWMLGTLRSPRLFDIPEPVGNETWTINLIEHLCKCDDEINQLKDEIST